MKLTYKILWIEDKPETIIGKRKALIKYLRDIKGFDVDIVDANTFEGFEKEVGYDGLKVYDLLLVDLDLGNEIDTNDGNAIITKIRDDKIYTEIIFYSANYDALHTKLQQNPIEGIFTSPRKDITIKAQAIIDVTLNKVQDVNNLRGLIMAEVAELDRLKKNIIKRYSSQELDDRFKKYIKTDVFNQLKENVEKYDYLLKDDDSYKSMNLEHLVDELIYDSAKKARTVYKIKRNIETCQDIDYTLKEYESCIIDKRNILAHEEEKTDPSDGSKYLTDLKNKGILKLTEDECVKIRKDIRKYKKVLIEIEEKINEQ